MVPALAGTVLLGVFQLLYDGKPIELAYPARLLPEVLQKVPGLPRLVVVTLCHGEIAHDHPLCAFQTTLYTEAHHVEIGLHPLAMVDSLQTIEQTFKLS